MGPTEHFHSPCEKRFSQKRCHYFIRKFFTVLLLAMQNFFVFRDGPLAVVGNVRLVRIQSFWILNLLIVAVHFNFGKNWVQNVVYKSTERNWSLLLLFFFKLLFLFFGIASFVTATLQKFQFQSQVRVSKQHDNSNLFESQTLCFLFHWVGGIFFLFAGWQDNVNY